MAAMLQDETADEILRIAKEICKTEGAGQVTVRKIITQMGVTNRVFYNRYRSRDALLYQIYSEAVTEMHRCVDPHYTDKDSFFQFCLETGEQVLGQTYDIKRQFKDYYFAHTELTDHNRDWWSEQVRRHYTIAHENGWIQVTDIEKIGVSLWCMCRGYLEDAAVRAFTKDEALQAFRFGMTCYLKGLMEMEA